MAEFEDEVVRPKTFFEEPDPNAAIKKRLKHFEEADEYPSIGPLGVPLRETRVTSKAGYWADLSPLDNR